MTICTRLMLAASLTICCTPAISCADTLRLGAAADNTLFQDQLGGLSSGAGQYLFSGNLNNSASRRALLRFDLTTLPAGVIITAVSLRLHMSRSVASGEVVSVFAATRAWGEGTSNAGIGGAGAPAQPGDATWLYSSFNTTSWTNPGGDFAATSSASTIVGGIANYTWSGAGMVADAQAWLENPAANFGWLLQGNEIDAQTVKRFDSRENADASVRPELTITYIIPAPGAAMLLAAGGLIVSRRRR